MIVLTGATGGIGSQVLKHLLYTCHVPPTEIALSIYNPTPSPTFIASLPPGIQVRHGDFSQPASLDEAFKGADTLLIVSYPSIAYEVRVKAHINAIDAAKRVGTIKRIWYTSLAFGGETGVGKKGAENSGQGKSASAVMSAHLDTEQYLKESGIEYTILREGIYAESYPLYLGFFDPKDTDVYVPGEGRIAWASREDLGEATARLIAEGSHPNETLLLSGPTSNNLTLSELANLLSGLLSRPINLHIITVDEYVKRFHDENSPWGGEQFLRDWAKTYDAMEKGETGVASTTLGDILGRAPRAMEDCVKQALGQDAIGQYAK